MNDSTTPRPMAQSAYLHRINLEIQLTREQLQSRQPDPMRHLLQGKLDGLVYARDHVIAPLQRDYDIIRRTLDPYLDVQELIPHLTGEDFTALVARRYNPALLRFGLLTYNQKTFNFDRTPRGNEVMLIARKLAKGGAG